MSIPLGTIPDAGNSQPAPMAAATKPLAAAVDASTQADMEALSQSLANTLAMDRSVRKAAEADLEARARSPATYALLLLKIMRAHASGSATANDLQTQLAQQSCLMSAAVALKNIVKNRWDDSATAPPADEDGPTNATSEDDVTGTSTAAVGDFGPADCEARASIRDEILACLLASEKDDLTKTLAEAFRVIVSTDFPARWDSLLPKLRSALEAADDPSDPSSATAATNATDNENPTSTTTREPTYKLEQVLVAVSTLSKQYVYFRSDAKEPNAVPADLERISVEVMKPLLKHTLPRLVKLLSAPKGKGDDASAEEAARTRSTECAYMICKAYNRLTKAYLPVVLGGTEGTASTTKGKSGKKGKGGGGGTGSSGNGSSGSNGVSELGDQALSSMLSLLRITLLPQPADHDNKSGGGDDEADADADADDAFSRALDLPQWRLAKRVLTSFQNLIERHSKALTVHSSVTDLLTVVWQALAKERVRMPDVIAALCLDTATLALELPFHRVQVLERASEDAILRGVLLPALSVSSDDQELWAEDEDEYFNRNLSMELEGVVDTTPGSSEGRHSARKSVLALLTAIAADDLKAKADAEAAKASSGKSDGPSGGGGRKGKKGKGGGGGRRVREDCDGDRERDQGCCGPHHQQLVQARRQGWQAEAKGQAVAATCSVSECEPGWRCDAARATCCWCCFDHAVKSWQVAQEGGHALLASAHHAERVGGPHPQPQADGSRARDRRRERLDQEGARRQGAHHAASDGAAARGDPPDPGNWCGRCRRVWKACVWLEERGPDRGHGRRGGADAALCGRARAVEPLPERRAHARVNELAAA